MKSFFLIACALFCSVLQSGSADCKVPQTLTYSGLLSEGGVLAEASVRLTFTLYDAASGGDDVWSETFDNVDVENGHFTVALGSSESIIPVLDGNVYWLEVSVNDGPGLLPRSAFDSVPYALKAKDADTISGQTIQQIQNGIVQTSIDVAYNNSSGLNATTVQSAVDELASRSTLVALPHVVTHQNGGSDEINVTGLNGFLADPQTPATHDHDDRYYTQPQVSDALTEKADIAEVIQKTAVYSQTFSHVFTHGSIGSPFTGDIPEDSGFNSGNTTIVPIISVTMDNFPAGTKPRFFYTVSFSGSEGTAFTVHVFNPDGDEVTPEVVSFNGWSGATIRIDVIWTAIP